MENESKFSSEYHHYCYDLLLYYWYKSTLITNPIKNNEL